MMETILGSLGLLIFWLVCVGAAKLMQGSDFGRRVNNEMERRGR